FTGLLSVSQGQLTAGSAGALGGASGDVTVDGGTLDMSGLSFTKDDLTVSSGTLQNGTMTVDTFAQSGGTVASTTTITGSGTATATQSGGTMSGTVNSMTSYGQSAGTMD